MKLAMTDQLLKTNASLQYQYCEDGDGAFAENVDDCVECLQDIQQSMALVNCKKHTYFALLTPRSRFRRRGSGIRATGLIGGDRSPRLERSLQAKTQSRQRQARQTRLRHL